uniref:peptidoglycan recognition protein family protein n=1 Tax=Lysinibacillus sp. 54212 TaxID=3119829 RepID=UPI003FA52EDB
EICYSKSGGERYEKAEENAVQYIAKLLYQHGWGIDRVKKHQDWSGKYCPHRILSEGRWESFKQRVQVSLNNLKNPVKKEEPKVTQLLNETGRKAARNMIKKGVEEKLFTSKHENVDKYSDSELISYGFAYIDRKSNIN